MALLMFLSLVQRGSSFLNSPTISIVNRLASHSLAMSSTTATDVRPLLSWTDLQRHAGETAVGAALNAETELRKQGKGSPHVQNKIRKFGQNDEPVITLFRDHAGW